MGDRVYGKVRRGHVGWKTGCLTKSSAVPPLSDMGSCFSYVRRVRAKHHLQERALGIQWELGRKRERGKFILQTPENIQVNHVPCHCFTNDRNTGLGWGRVGCQSDILPRVPYLSMSDMCENTFSRKDKLNLLSTH